MNKWITWSILGWAAWRIYVSNQTALPIDFAMVHPFASPDELKALWLEKLNRESPFNQLGRDVGPPANPNTPVSYAEGMAIASAAAGNAAAMAAAMESPSVRQFL